MASLFLVFKGLFILFYIVAAPIYIPTNSVERFPFSTPSPEFIVFDDGHSNHCEAVSHCSFDLHFST